MKCVSKEDRTKKKTWIKMKHKTNVHRTEIAPYRQPSAFSSHWVGETGGQTLNKKLKMNSAERNIQTDGAAVMLFFDCTVQFRRILISLVFP